MPNVAVPCSCCLQGQGGTQQGGVGQACVFKVQNTLIGCLLNQQPVPFARTPKPMLTAGHPAAHLLALGCLSF